MTIDTGAARNPRLEEMLVECLEAQERGAAIDRRAVLARYPELAAELAEFFAGQDIITDFIPQPPPTTRCDIERLGDHEILGVLRQGGMGVVYKAWQTRLGRMVAVKTIRAGLLARPDDQERFRAEMKLAASLDHPNIVTILDEGQDQGLAWFSMVYVEGQSLADMTKDHALPPLQAARHMTTIARAIQFAHDKSVLHRDIKPSNVLIDVCGRVRITDFGLAMRVGEDSGLTVHGEFIGTPSYSSPEQASGRSDIGKPSDVYSMGATLYALITGHPPFQGVTRRDTLDLVCNGDPIPPRRQNPNIPRDLETICLKCLSRRPEDRYDSARALAEDLRLFRKGLPIKARPDGAVTRLLGWGRRHRTAAILLGASAIALVTLTLWSLAGARAQERARRAEVLATNVYAASAVAGTVLAQLDEYAEWVAKEARDPRLAATLARGDEEALQALCGDIHARHGGAASHIAWWFVVDAGGTLRAYFPPAKMGKDFYLNFAFRDYFRGATALPEGADRPVYVSRAFHATTDDRYKIGISSPILGEGGTVDGVLVASIPTDRHLGALELSDGRRIAVLSVRRDREVPSDLLPNDHILLVHDGVEQGEGVVVESEALRRLTAKRDAVGADGHQFQLPPPEWVEPETDYHDPLAPGPWLAGIAAVGRTNLSGMF